MEFSSLLFIYAFFPIALLLYHFTPKAHRNSFLLLESTVFCGLIGAGYLLFTILFVLMNCIFGILTANVRKKSCRRIAAAAFIAVNAAAAIIFTSGMHVSDLLRSLLRPVGVCFMTLGAIGYIYDVSEKKVAAEKNIMNLALYFMLFTKLPMGPLIGYGSFSRQLIERSYSIERIGEGIELFIIGLAKKIIFADSIYPLFSAVNTLDVKQISALSAWLGSTGYVLCLYFTLSGYSDMGAGLSRCFGFTLPRSFRYPCVSIGMNSFCRSWHIPVVRRFEEMIASPLHRSSTSKAVKNASFIACWGIIGLWYSFRVSLLVWGIIIGTSAVIERYLVDRKALKATSLIYTSVIIIVSAVFFFGGTMSYSLHYLFAMIGGNNNIADGVSFYLLKSYALVLLISIYASTDLFRNLILRSKKRTVKNIADAVSPIVMTAILAICTALISSSGSCGSMLGFL